MDELQQLNSDLMQHLQPCRQEEPEPTAAPIAAPETKMVKVSSVFLSSNSMHMGQHKRYCILRTFMHMYLKSHSFVIYHKQKKNIFKSDFIFLCTIDCLVIYTVLCLLQNIRASELLSRSSRIPTSERKLYYSLFPVGLLQFIVGLLTCTSVILWCVSYLKLLLRIVHLKSQVCIKCMLSLCPPITLTQG